MPSMRSCSGSASSVLIERGSCCEFDTSRFKLHYGAQRGGRELAELDFQVHSALLTSFFSFLLALHIRESRELGTALESPACQPPAAHGSLGGK